MTRLTGDTTDISHISEFGWYDWVWFIYPQRTARWSGRTWAATVVQAATLLGDALSACILTRKGEFVSRTSVIPLSAKDERSKTVRERKTLYTKSLKEALGKRYVLAKDSLPSYDNETLEPN
jgi:hypothetical protein